MLKTGNMEEKKFMKENKQEPVVGYTGFLKGVKAENEYAKVYKDLAVNSIRRWWSTLMFYTFIFYYQMKIEKERRVYLILSERQMKNISEGDEKRLKIEAEYK